VTQPFENALAANRIDALAEQSALVRTQAVEFTVGAGGDHATIAAALAAASRLRNGLFANGGLALTIRLLTGFVMAEQIIVDRLDLGFITIVSDDAIVPVAVMARSQLSTGDITAPVFGGRHQAVLPTIGALFAFPNDGDGYCATASDGVACHGGSRVEFLPGAGIRRARRGLQLLGKSEAHCFIPGLTQGGAGSGAGTVTGVDFSYASHRAFHGGFKSCSSLPRSQFHHSKGDYAVYLIWGGDHDLYQSQVHDSLGTAIHARDNAKVNVRETQVARSRRGYHVLHGARANARSKANPRTLDFTRGQLPNGVTLTRASTADYVNNLGLSAIAAVDQPCFDYDATTLEPRGLLIQPASGPRAADVLTIDLVPLQESNGTFVVRYVFDDASHQDVATTITGTFTVPTNLTRPRIRTILLLTDENQIFNPWVGDGARDCIEYGVLCSHGSDIDAADLDVSGCGRRGVHASDNGRVNFIFGQANDCGESGLSAVTGGKISAFGASADRCAIGVNNKGGSICFDFGSAIECDTGVSSIGGSVDFQGGRADDCRIGVIGNRAATINADTSSAQRCTEFGFYAGATTNMDARNSNASGVSGALVPNGFYAYRGGKLNCRGSLAQYCGNGVTAYEGGKANAQSVNADHCGTFGFFIDRGGDMVVGAAIGTRSATQMNVTSGAGVMWDQADTNRAIGINETFSHATGYLAGTWGRKLKTTVSVQDAPYSAKADYAAASDGVAVSGDNTFTSASAAFSASDIGKLIHVVGAGAAGAVLKTTIASINSATSIEMAAPAGTSISLADYQTGTDCYAAIQACIDACAGKARVYIPGGKYLRTGGEFKVPSNSDIFGDAFATFIHVGYGLEISDCGFTNSQNTRSDANTGNENILLRGITLYGARGHTTGSLSTGTDGCGFGLAFVTNAKIENCYAHNWPKHCFDVSAKYYWTDTNPNTTLNVAGPSTNISLINCGGSLSGDDIFTTHYSGSILIVNPYAVGSGNVANNDFGNRNGVEIDDGSYDVTVLNMHVANCNSGLEVKAHAYAPAARRVRVSGGSIRGCARSINLRHMGFYGPEYSTTARDVLIEGLTIYTPAGVASGGLAPRAIRVASYDGVQLKSITIVGTDDVLGIDPAPEADETSAPVYLHQGAQNVLIEDMTFRNYGAAIDGLIRITGSGRGTHTLRRIRAEDCAQVPVVKASGSLPNIRIDGVHATRTGTAATSVVEFSYRPEDHNGEVLNVYHDGGYETAVQTSTTLSKFPAGRNVGVLERWGTALSSGDGTVSPKAAVILGWVEGDSQDTGIGEGRKISFQYKLSGDANIYEGASIGGYKVSGTDANQGTGIRVATRANGDAGLGATDRWVWNSLGHYTPFTDNAYDHGSATLRTRASYVIEPHVFPAASVTPTVNGELTLDAPSDTKLTHRFKGSDGVVRSADMIMIPATLAKRSLHKVLGRATGLTTGATVKTALWTLPIAAGEVQAGDILRISVVASVPTGSVNTNPKYVIIELGGQTFFAPAGTTFTATVRTICPAPLDVHFPTQATQISRPPSTNSGTSVSPPYAGTVDMAVAQDLVVSGYVGTGGDILNVDSVLVELIRMGT
jgi:hypothetical protein